MIASFTAIFVQTEKVEFVFYALFGLVLACTPSLMKLWVQFHQASGKDNLLENSRAVLFKKYGYFLSFPLAAAIFSGLIHFWSDHIEMMGVVTVLKVGEMFELVCASAVVTTVIIYFITKPYKNPQENKIVLSAIAFIFLISALAINLSTSFFETSNVFLGDHFHNWGAFISAAKSLDAGLAIFKDFPTQYGLGPSILISIAAHWFGWISGMFYVAGLLQFFYWFSITAIAIKLIKNLEGNKYVLWVYILLISTFSCLFWIPPDTELYSNFAPSLGGARYLPATFFVAVLLSLNLTTQNFSQKKVWVLHVVWALCTLWSIESAFYLCLIWWPYYLYIRLPAKGNLRQGFGSLSKSIFELLFVATVLVISFVAVYWAVYKTLPEFSVFTAFVSNIPGPLLIDFTGAFIFAASIFVISFVTLILMHRKYGNSKEFHYLFVLILLAYAAFSYFVGRSADYNIRPLMPFFCLILLSMCQVKFPQFVRYFSITLLSILTCWVGIGQYNNNFNRFHMATFSGSQLDSKFQKYRENPDLTDLGRAIAFISKNYNESAIAVDPISTITISGNQNQWNAYNNIASYNYLPNQMQKEFINRSKEKIMEPGWVLVHKDMGIYGEPFILDLFKYSYNLNKEITFGEYKALRFTPKPNL